MLTLLYGHFGKDEYLKRAADVLGFDLPAVRAEALLLNSEYVVESRAASLEPFSSVWKSLFLADRFCCKAAVEMDSAGVRQSGSTSTDGLLTSSNGHSTSTNMDVTSSPIKDTYCADSELHHLPKAELAAQGIVLAPPPLSQLPSGRRDMDSRQVSTSVELATKSTATPFVIEPEDSQIGSNIKTLKRLQNETATKVKENESAQKLNEDQFQQGLRYLEAAKSKVESLQVQTDMAQAEFEAAKEKQKHLRGAKAKCEHMAQRYRDYEKDLEQVAKIQEEQNNGLRSLSVPSLGKIMATLLELMINGIADKYPDLLPNESLA